jgi:hypothetical protein
MSVSPSIADWMRSEFVEFQAVPEVLATGWVRDLAAGQLLASPLERVQEGGAVRPIVVAGILSLEARHGGRILLLSFRVF